MFGAELGFFAGGAASAGLLLGVASAMSDDTSAPSSGGGEEDGRSGHGAMPLLALPMVGLMAGGTALGGWGFHRAAKSGAWDTHAGWGAAGVPPALMTGFAFGGGLALAADRDAPLGASLAAAGLGAGVMGALGYAAFRGMSSARGTANAEIVGAWVGFFTAEVAGLAFAQGLPGGTQENGHVMLLSAAFGGVLGTLGTHLIARLAGGAAPERRVGRAGSASPCLPARGSSTVRCAVSAACSAWNAGRRPAFHGHGDASAARGGLR